ncbi:hypothetical protein OIY81_1591 [Cryptosporidium canis]|uniref:Integral membrane protein n=1 Tax=Cryptosporidium canis TaxID=195482 RepID=A0ABQ8P7M1_9CRYT|nr:hypothetical protein OJ252_1617 [Cryptosporidium canis]KAJ1611731.1 hypothetical protein OIY81_1591 [Cryptosporidium canis]
MNGKRESLRKLLILLLNIILIFATLFTILFLNVGYYRWGFSNGSNVKYSVCLNRIYSEAICINTSIADFEGCSEMIELENFKSNNIPSSILSSPHSIDSIKNIIVNIKSASLTLTCLIVAYLVFLSFSTLVLLIKDYIYNKRYAHIFSVILIGISILFITSGLVYWILMHISWGKTLRIGNNNVTIQVIYHSLASGYYIFVGVLLITLIELIILFKILPDDREYSKYSLIS